MADESIDVPTENNPKRPIKMLHDRILVRMPTDEADRRSSGGILIPATAQQQKRLVWGEVVGAGPNVRSAEEGDHVLFLSLIHISEPTRQEANS